jgi:glycosyltransferase involved in cell wall biosynthesis
MRRKVVLVIGQLQQGGAEGQLAHLALGLAASGIDPTVACLSEVAEPHASRLREAGVPVAIFPRRGHGDLSRVRGLASLLRSAGADLVHSFLVGANAYAYASARLAGVRPLIVSSRTTMTMPTRSRRLLHAWIFRRASIVVANAESVKEFTSSYYGVPRARLRVVRNGVDLGASMRASVDREAARAEMGIPAGAVLVGTLGRLSREKNLDLFVDMAAGLANEFPEARFVIVGEGPCRGAIERALRGAGIDGRVVVTGARSDVARVLAAMDLFVMTSDTEGLPNAVMEAMAAALPVVSTRVGGVHELVADGETGRLFPRGQLVPLLSSVRPLIRDADLRRRQGEAGRRRIASEFSVERMVAATVSVYDEVLPAAPGDGAA